jgi:hypothetical protein
MAAADLNASLDSLRGGIGGYVYRRFRGKTVVQRRPTFTRPWTRQQATTRTNFAGASAFAARVKADPDLKPLYVKRGRRLLLNFRQMAIRDYMYAPTVEDINRGDYTAATGGTLRFRAHDDFAVTDVIVVLRDDAGGVLAYGRAVKTLREWRFAVAPPSPGAKRPASGIVTVYDCPGNFAVRTFALGSPAAAVETQSAS